MTSSLPLAAPADARRPARVNLLAPAFRMDPHPMLHEMRSRERVSRDRLGNWLLCRHDDVNTALRTRLLSRHPWRSTIYRTLRPFLADSTLEHNIEHWLMFTDPPKHTRLRAAVNASFRPPVIEALRERITDMTERLLDGWTGERFELIEGLARPLPLMVLCDVLGLPTDEAEQTRPWSDALATIFEPEKGRDARINANRATEEMLAFMKDHVNRHRQARRRDTLLGMLIGAQEEQASVSEDELLANLVLLFIAGTETTTNLIGNGVMTLLRHPEQLELLLSQPSLMPLALEEIVRYESPLALTDRYTIDDYQVGDVRVPKGQLIYLMLMAANRDPAVFQDPDRFDVTRSVNPHVEFGAGIHYCVGAPLARLEAEVAFQCLWKRVPRMHMVDEVPQWRPLVNLRGLESLHVARGARSVAAMP
jgi:pimeloyl-[acyl-carrier protein] synthase